MTRDVATPRRAHHGRLVGIAALVAAAVVVAAGPAVVAQTTADPGPTVVVRELDTRDHPAETAVVAVAGSDATPTVRVGGDEVPAEVRSLSAADRSTATVIIVDTSQAAEDTRAAAVLREVAAGVAVGVGGGPLALLTTGPEPALQAPFGRSAADALAALERVENGGPNRLRDTVAAAVDLLAARSRDGDLGQIVVITATGDQSSSTPAGVARADAVEGNIWVHAAVIGEPARFLDEITSATGGRIHPVDPADPAAAAASVTGDLSHQWVLSWDHPVAEVDEVSVVIRAADAETGAVAPVGTVVDGVRTRPEVLEVHAGLLDNPLVLWVGLALLAAAVGLAGYAVHQLVTAGDDRLDRRLAVYTDGVVPSGDDEPAGRSIRDSAVARRLLDLTSRLAERQGMLPKVEAALERADIPLRPAEALFLWAAGALGGALVATVMFRSLLMAPVTLGVLAALPPALVNNRARSRTKRFQSQLPDALHLLAGSLRAGYSLMQAVEAVSQEIDDPMGRELRRVVTEARLGRPLDEALNDAAQRMNSPDFEWAVMAIRIQREVGGNLADLLVTVADTMVQRERLRRDVNALTAEGRMSAYVLGILPFALAGVMWAINPDYINVLFTHPTGNMLLGFSVILAGFGFAWMRKMIQVDI